MKICKKKSREFRRKAKSGMDTLLVAVEDLLAADSKRRETNVHPEEKNADKQVSKSFATFCCVFRVHALACSRQRSAAGKQTEVWTLNFSKYLETFVCPLSFSDSDPLADYFRRYERRRLREYAGGIIRSLE